MLYHDHSAMPELWAADVRSQGVTIRKGRPDAAIDPTLGKGYAIQRLSGHRDPYGGGHRYVSLGLVGIQGPDPHRVFSVIINGAE
jgi:hypothetical protein